MNWKPRRFSKILALSMALLGVLSLAVPSAFKVSAQDGFSCPMSDDDCAILLDGFKSLTEADSYQIDTFSLNLNTAIIDQETKFSAAGSGRISQKDNQLELRYDSKNDAVCNTSEATGRILRVVDGTAYRYDAASDLWTGQVIEATPTNDLQLSAILDLLYVFNDDNVVTWIAEENSEINGQSVAVYRAQIDLARFSTTDTFVNLLAGIMSNTTGSMPEGGGSGDVSAVVQALLTQLSDQLRTATFDIVFKIDPIQPALVGISVNLDANVELAFIQSFGGSIQTTLDIVLSNYNQPVTIAPPATWEAGEIDLGLAGLLGFGDNQLRAEQSMAYGETLEGTLDNCHPERFYSFTASQGDVVTITLAKSGESSLLDTYLRLFDGLTMVVAENDDALDNPTIGSFDSEIKAFEILADGEYIIEVSWLDSVEDGAFILTLTQE